MPTNPTDFGVTCRDARVQDLTTAARLFAEYRCFYGRPLDLGIAERFLTERLTNAESRIFMAETGGDAPPPVAVGFAQVYESFSSVDASRIWILNDLFVDERHRGRGVGRSLLAYVHQQAHARGALRVELETALDNVSARRLYEAFGYQAETGFVHYSRRV